MARGKVKVGAKAKAKVRPVKAGKNSKHGGFPTQKAIAIRAEIIADLKHKGNG